MITLVIIGIVAAITVPSISKASEKYILRNQFKKTYSTIVNAMNKADTELGGNTACFYRAGTSAESVNDECQIFFDRMFSYLNIQKVCNGNAKAEGCIPTPYMKNYVTSGGGSGFNRENIETINTVYDLADGTIIIKYRGPLPLCMVDINGAKGPNTLGKDIFTFFMESDGINGLKIRNNYISIYANPDERYFTYLSDIYGE